MPFLNSFPQKTVKQQGTSHIQKMQKNAKNCIYPKILPQNLQKTRDIQKNSINVVPYKDQCKKRQPYHAKKPSAY